MEHVVEQEQGVIYGGFINWHRPSPGRAPQKLMECKAGGLLCFARSGHDPAAAQLKLRVTKEVLVYTCLKGRQTRKICDKSQAFLDPEALPAGGNSDAINISV